MGLCNSKGAPYRQVGEGKRLFVVSSVVKDTDKLSEALLPDVLGCSVNYESGSLEKLVRLIEGTKIHYESIALAAHGKSGHFALFKEEPLTMETLEDVNKVALWTRLAAATERVDILGCSVAEGEGMRLIDRLESLTGTNFAASDDKTGSAGGMEDVKDGGADMILETDGINLVSEYFDKDKIKDWTPELFVMAGYHLARAAYYGATGDWDSAGGALMSSGRSAAISVLTGGLGDGLEFVELAAECSEY